MEALAIGCDLALGLPISDRSTNLFREIEYFLDHFWCMRGAILALLDLSYWECAKFFPVTLIRARAPLSINTKLCMLLLRLLIHDGRIQKFKSKIIII